MKINFSLESVKRCTFESLKYGECFTVYGPYAGTVDNDIYMKVTFVNNAYAVDLNDGKLYDTFSDDESVYVVDGAFKCKFVPADKEENK
jgi:hypothetical protein